MTARTVKITDPATKEILVLEKFEASTESELRTALGRNPCDRNYSCDEETQAIWPIRFKLTAKGHIDTRAEGRLIVTATGTYTASKEGAIENAGGFHVTLEREATGDKLGGWANHVRISTIIRNAEDKLRAPARASIIERVGAMRRKEEIASSAHAARARVAATLIPHLQGKKK